MSKQRKRRTAYPAPLNKPSAPVLLPDEVAAEKAGIVYRRPIRKKAFSARKTQCRRLRLHEKNGLRMLLEHYNLEALPESVLKYRKLALRLARVHVEYFWPLTPRVRRWDMKARRNLIALAEYWKYKAGSASERQALGWIHFNFKDDFGGKADRDRLQNALMEARTDQQAVAAANLALRRWKASPNTSLFSILEVKEPSRRASRISRRKSV